MTDAPAIGELDVLAAPLPYADDRKRFEGALSRVAGVRDVRAIATTGKTHRVRIAYSGTVPLVERLASLKDFKVRVLAQTTTSVQLLIEDR